MKDKITTSSNPRYIVKVGKDGQQRLNVLHQIFCQGTKNFLLKAGLNSNMTVIDAGCGLGHVAIEMAKIVGPNGRIIAIDDNEKQLELAQKNVQAENLQNVDFICSSIDSLTPEILGRDIDFIYGRFILIHSPHPEHTLKNLYQLLKAGGIFAFEEPDMSSYFANPPIEAFSKAIKWCLECGKTVGLNFDVGNTLFYMMTQLGLEDIDLSLHQPVAISQPQKSIISLLTEECKPKYLEYQIASSEEIDLVINQLREFENAKYTYCGCARQYQVFGIKSAKPRKMGNEDQISLKAAIDGIFHK